jgi:Protein of unknown function (DUF3892)
MHPIAETLRSHISKDVGSSRTEILKLFDEMPPVESVKIFVEACSDFDPQFLGWRVFPLLTTHLRENDHLFYEMMSLFIKQDINRNFLVILMDYLDGAARTTKKKMYQSMLTDLCGERNDRIIRAIAGRRLARVYHKNTLLITKKFIESDEQLLLDTAAHIMRQWIQHNKSIPKGMISSFLRRVSISPKSALWSSAIIGLIAEIRTTSAKLILDKIITFIQTDDERALFLGAAGESLDDRRLAKLIKGLTKSQNNPKSNDVLKGIFFRQPSRLRRLYVLKFFEEFLYVYNLMPDTGNGLYVKLLQALTKSKNYKVRDQATDLSARPIYRKYNKGKKEKYSSAVRSKNKSNVSNKSLDLVQQQSTASAMLHHSPIDVSVTDQGLSIGFHVADALYRDLTSVPTSITGEHWHAGIYLGITLDRNFEENGIAYMKGIAAYRGLGWSDTIDYFSASRSFNGPHIDIKATMLALKNDFLLAFAEGRINHPFHGSRCPSDVNPDQRQAIANTARTLYGKNIWWTWADMLDYKNEWDGSANSIDETRCDGVVEYSYERNGVRVCGGVDKNKWNISQPGIQFPENHNDVHNGDFVEPGELCPRIQAGDQGNDTTFVYSFQNPPSLTILDARGFSSDGVPMIAFKVNSDTYQHAYVRITVSKDGGRVDYLYSEKPEFNSGDSRQTDAHWNFKGIATNNEYRIYWIGRTIERGRENYYSDGPHYYGDNGIFDFRIRAVDPAGNVSEQQSVKLNIQWPSEIKCINKKVRKAADDRIRLVGGILPNGQEWRMHSRHIQKLIREKKLFYVERPQGDRVNVILAYRNPRRPYIKTEADGDIPNNLLSLPECPGAS